MKTDFFFLARRPRTVEEWFSRLPRLQTPRLELRKVTLHDAEDIFSYSRDPQVAKHVLWSAHTSVQDSRNYVRYLQRQYHEGTPSSYCIVLKETDRVIGTIGFMNWQRDNEALEVGYSMAREHWGKGLMPEALSAVLRLAFEQMHVHRVYAIHETDNPASGRVMAKCGMRPEGVMRGAVWNKGRYVDVAMYGILQEEWEKLKKR